MERCFVAKTYTDEIKFKIKTVNSAQHVHILVYFNFNYRKTGGNYKGRKWWSKFGTLSLQHNWPDGKLGLSNSVCFRLKNYIQWSFPDILKKEF